MRVISWAKKHPMLLAATISSISVTIIWLVVLFVLHYTPFGDNTLTMGDAQVQYLDFFAFFRRVLCGQDSLLFSFSKGLGGSVIGVFSYYLSSPFNWLVCFFTGGGLNTLLSILVILKSALAAAFFAIFLVWRFCPQPSEHTPQSNRLLFIILLSMCYGLSEYFLSQSSSIMWLDGVYMLPLIMLGVSKLVHSGKSMPLAIIVSLSIIFNWYTGAMNCIFAVLWLIFELALCFAEHRKITSRTTLQIIGKFTLAMLLGVLVSCIIFLPTVLEVIGSSHGAMRFDLLLRLRVVGFPPSIIGNYYLGSTSDFAFASVFCGSLMPIGLVSLLLSKNVPKLQKTIFALFALLLVFCCYFFPFMLIFSLFEEIGSYWYRYGYIIIAGLLTLAAYYFCHYASSDSSKIVSHAGIYAALAILLCFALVEGGSEESWLWWTLCFIIIAAFLSSSVLSRPRRLNCILLFLVITGELMLETAIFVRSFRNVRMDDVENYATEASRLVEETQKMDPGFYRISQTEPNFSSGVTANYDESFAYGYAGIASYTSMVDDQQIALLDRLGYRGDGYIKTIVKSPVIGTDSLLGVRYIMSKYPVKGLLPTDISSSTSPKRVYENPYALPIGLTYRDNDLEIIYDTNPFTYQNAIYSKLLGRPVELYKPIKFKLIASGNVTTNQSQQYLLDVPKGNYTFYGNIPVTSGSPDLTLRIGDNYAMSYGHGATIADWGLTPSVFYIPPRDTDKVTIELESSTTYNIATGSEQFYALDLNLLADITDELISNNHVTQSSIRNGDLSFVIDDANDAEHLYVAVAEDKGWTITRNGEKIDADLIADKLYSVPLTTGRNEIHFSYSVPGFKSGVCLSLCGITGIVALGFIEHQRVNQSEYNRSSKHKHTAKTKHGRLHEHQHPTRRRNQTEYKH